jgi:hypothetical protein
MKIKKELREMECEDVNWSQLASGYGLMADCCENGKVNPGFTNYGEFFH